MPATVKRTDFNNNTALVLEFNNKYVIWVLSYENPERYEYETKEEANKKYKRLEKKLTNKYGKLNKE